MTNFARFEAPTITLVHEDSSSKTRRGIDSIWSDVSSAAGSVESSVESAAGSAESAVETYVSAVATAAQAIETAAEAEANKIIDEIGDSLSDIEDAVMGLMENILDTIQDSLNEWLQEATSALTDLDISRKMSLHLTTYCTSSDYTNSTSSSSSSSNSTNSNSTSYSMACNQLFSSGGASEFNATENNGTIWGFQPGAVLYKALGVLYFPISARDDVKEPVDSAANSVEKLIQEAGNDLSAWSIDLIFIPIVAVFVVAAVFTGFLIVLLIATTVYSLRAEEPLPPRVYSVFGTIAAIAALFLLLGSVIITVIALMAWVVDLAGGVVNITVSSGHKLKWMSWAAFFIMAFVAACLKVEEFVAEVVFWWGFLRKLFGGRKRDAMRDMRGTKHQNN